MRPLSLQEGWGAGVNLEELDVYEKPNSDDPGG